MSREHDRFPTEEATRVDVRAAGGEPDELDLAALLPALDDHPGPARRIPSGRSAAMVRSIVDRALDVPAELPMQGPDPLPARPQIRRDHDDHTPFERALPHDDLERSRRQREVHDAYRRRSPRRLAWMAAALVITLAGGAAAAAWVAAREPANIVLPPLPSRPPRVPTPPPSKPVLEPRTESIDVPIDMPAEVVDPRRTPSRPAADNLPNDAPPADVLALANQRRKEKRWRDADALYRRVISRYAGSDAAVVATVASADLHLNRLADPAGSLRLYGDALRLRPRGPLAEESRWGVAEAQRALGDTNAEAKALRAFAAAHPDSANAPAARRRLSEIAPVR